MAKATTTKTTKPKGAKAASDKTSTTKKGAAAQKPPRLSAAQKKAEGLKERASAQGYVVVDKGDGRYYVKETPRSRKPIVDNLTISGLEGWVNGILGDPETTPPDELNKAIAAEMSETSDEETLDPNASRRSGEWVEPSDIQEEEEGEEVVSEVNWDLGKGKCPIGDKSAKSAHTFYKGKNLYLVEAKYAPDTWAVYIERSLVASSVQGFESAERAAIDAAIKLVEAENFSVPGETTEEILQSLDNAKDSGLVEKTSALLSGEKEKESKGKSKKTATASEPEPESADEVLPSDNPNTDPRLAVTLKRIFNVSREADLIGSTSTPVELVNSAITKLEPMQIKGDLMLSDLLDALQCPVDTKRMEIALFLAKNGVEIKFLPEDRIELKTTAPATLPF